MQFKIVNREIISQGWCPDEPSILISITDTRCKHTTPSDKYTAVLKSTFDDVSTQHTADIHGYKLISDEDAAEIMEFVNEYKDKVKTIVVNCEAGISRSAGVAAALAKIVNGDDTEIFKIRPYLNQYVYKTILYKHHKMYGGEI